MRNASPRCIEPAEPWQGVWPQPLHSCVSVLAGQSCFVTAAGNRSSHSLGAEMGKRRVLSHTSIALTAHGAEEHGARRTPCTTAHSDPLGKASFSELHATRVPAGSQFCSLPAVFTLYLLK